MYALVVDDSRAMRMILRRNLQHLGFTVCEARDGIEALAVLEGLGQVPEVALVDWNMPGMDGLDFIKAVHSNPHWSTMTVIVASSEGAHARIVEALTAGAHEYLVKPFEQQAVIDKLTQHGLPRHEVPV